MRYVMLIVALMVVVLTPPRYAADDGEAKEDDQPLDVETILANPLDEDAYRDSRHCISTTSFDAVEIVDESIVLFHGRRGNIWLNRLSGRCRGLRWDMIPSFQTHGSRVCERDRFRGRSRSGFDDSMNCILGKFEKIDEGQVESLRAARGVGADSDS